MKGDALLCNKYARIGVNESICGEHGLAVSQKQKKKKINKNECA